MSARRAIGLLVSVAALSGCGGADLPVPAPTSVTPARGSAGQATPIVIQGSGFSALVVQSASGGAPAVNETFRAWLGDVPLQEVRRVDDATLSATVPAGLPLGPGTLRVEGPYGTSGELANAFTVDAPPVGALTAAISAAPATVSVGQSITVTLSVQNTGTAGLTGVVPGAPSVTGTGTTGTPAGPTPASLATLAPGASGSFTWTYPTSGAGALAFAGSAAGSSVPSGATVAAATDPTLPARVTVERPAALTATLPVSGSAAVNRDFTVSMTVANTGGAAARNVVPGTPALAPEGLAALKAGTGPVPASVASLATGASTTFTWTFVAGTTPGTVRISAAASGSDANSGAAISSATATSGDFTIGAAGIQATLAVAQATTNVGQPLALTLSVSNPGLAAVNGFTVAGPVVTSTDGATARVTAGPTPSPPAVLSPGQSETISWTVDPAVAAGASTGNLSFRVTAGGVDAFSGTPISAEPTAAVTVETPAEVTATGLAATPETVVVGQPVSVTLGLGKTGAAAASVTDATLTGITCSTPPVLPVAVSGPTNTLTWSGCAAPSTPQTLTLGASATWVDVNVPLTPRTTNAVLATVGVQAAAGLSVAFLAQPPSPVSAGQVLTLTARVANTAPAGGAAAIGVTVAPTFTTVTGGATASCGAAAPGATAIAAGTAQDYTFTCTVSGAGTLTFTASASGTAAGTGTPLSAAATTAPATTVLAAAGISVTFLAQPPSPVSAGQVIALTARVANTAPAGGAAAIGVTVAPTFTTVTGGATASCGAAAPGATAIAAAAAQDYAFTCTVSGAGTLTFTASASGTAAGTGTPLSAAATTAPPTTVLAAAGISVTFLAQPPSPVSAGQVIALTPAWRTRPRPAARRSR